MTREIPDVYGGHGSWMNGECGIHPPLTTEDDDANQNPHQGRADFDDLPSEHWLTTTMLIKTHIKAGPNATTFLPSIGKTT